MLWKQNEDGNCIWQCAVVGCWLSKRLFLLCVRVLLLGFASSKNIWTWVYSLLYVISAMMLMKERVHLKLFASEIRLFSFF